MTYNEIKEFLKHLNVFKTRRFIYIKNHFPEILSEIKTQTKFLDDTNKRNVEISFQERIACIENGITSRPVCQHCHKEHVYFNTDTNRYRDFCSAKCSRSSKQVKTKRENTLEFRYGSKNFNNSEKSRSTRLSKNGSWHSKDFSSKVKKTLLKKYGDEKWNNPEKAEITCLNRYGVHNPFQSKDIQQKAKETFLKNHPGMKSTMDVPGIKDKISLGTRLRSWEYISNNSLVEPMFSREEYISCENPVNVEFRFKCKKCGNIFTSNWDNGMSKLCEICHPGLRGTSESEKEVYEFLKSIIPLGWKVFNREELNRTIISPKEIDIVVCDEESDIKLLLEYDGLYFHSDSETTHKKHTYHLEKTEMCEEKNHQLIHVFENEWLTKRDIVCSRLKNMLGIYDNVVFARKCSITELDKKTTEEFMIKNHIQGSCISSVNYGLVYNNNIVSVMTFGKSRFNRNCEWELLRFCNRLGFHVIGGAGKLLKHFERENKPKSLISYADRRWSMGNMYRQLGFDLSHKSSPNYWYFKPNNPSVIFNRIKFRKSNLKNVLEKFDVDMSEVENMHNNGYLRIFDCGNLVFVKNYQS